MQPLAIEPVEINLLEAKGRFRSNNVSEKPAVDLLNNLFDYCVTNKISDIHLKINDLHHSEIRIRVDGVLQPYESNIPANTAELILSKVCSKAMLNEKERTKGLDGRLHLYFDGRPIDGRVSMIPTNMGRKIVIRVLDSDNAKLNIDDFEIPAILKDTLKRIISNPEGVMVVTGPTGSGKTTTLYSSLQYRNNPSVEIVTIEHPVEYSIPEFDQINVTDLFSFSKALTAVLRQDPDIIMVGEIRDEASAEAAFQAGETGHMVFTTVHAMDALDTFLRLMGYGLSRQHIAGVLSGILAQRLVKRIHPEAQIRWTKPTDIERRWLDRFGFINQNIQLPRVDPEDFHGRIPMMELVEITAEMRHLLSDDSTARSEILRAAVKQPQFETLTQAGMRLVLAGKTTLSEVIAATKDSVAPPPFKRFEQIMVEYGWLTMEQLDAAFIEFLAQRDNGRIVDLEDILISQGACKESDIARATELAGTFKEGVVRSPNAEVSPC